MIQTHPSLECTMFKSLVSVLAGCGILATTSIPPTLHTPPRPALELTARAAAGDTLSYKFSWGAAAGATGYRVKVYPINPVTGGNIPTTWTQSPGVIGQGVQTATPSLNLKLINTSWDSVTFRIVVHSYRPSSAAPNAPLTYSADSSMAQWKVVRLGAPGPIVIDSSLVVVGMRAITQPILGEINTVAVCPIVKFYKGGEAIPVKYSAAPCQSIADTLRRSTKQQQVADTTSLTIAHTDRSGAFSLILPE